MVYMPVSMIDFAEKDENAFKYLFLQCCNDVKDYRFSPEIPLDVILQLGALYLRFSSLDTSQKITSKTIDDIGIDNFIPLPILNKTKTKELKKILLYFLSSNAPSLETPVEELDSFQVKLQYLDLLSTLPGYGTLCFCLTEYNDRDDMILLLNPKYGLNKVSSNFNSEVSLILSL